MGEKKFVLFILKEKTGNFQLSLAIQSWENVFILFYLLLLFLSLFSKSHHSSLHHTFWMRENDFDDSFNAQLFNHTCLLESSYSFSGVTHIKAKQELGKRGCSRALEFHGY
jgi:hypothetical protein